MLTRKQQELLFFIHDSMKRNGISPSFDEMKTALDLASKSGIHRLITALEERGFIRRLPNRARALEIIRLPQNIFAPPQNGQQFMPSVINGGSGAESGSSVFGSAHSSALRSRRPLASVKSAFSDAVKTGKQSGKTAAEKGIEIPLMGRIAAGEPISALQHKTNMLFCPANMLGKGEHYALEIKGDSMVNAGILNNDIVIIQRSETASPGEIVVALVDDIEATLKRYRRKGDSIALEAANPAYETRIFGPYRIKIQGRLVGLLRHY